MKRIIAILMSAVLCASAFCACSNPEEFSDSENLSKKYTRASDVETTFNYSDGATEPPYSYNVYANVITDFELKLFRNYYSQRSDKDSSFVISPVSTALQLDLIGNGTSGDTKSELLFNIGKDLTNENINQCASYFKSRIQSVSQLETDKKDSLSGEKSNKSGECFVKLEGNLYFNDVSDVKKKFLQTNADYYGDGIYRFKFDGDDSLSKINGCFSEFTDGSAVTELDKDQSLISVTAADLCDKWLEPYAAEDIVKGTFKSGKTDKEVNFMTSNETYMKSKKAQGILKYTSNNPLKMMLVMPNEGISLEDYISDFNNLEYSNLISSIDITKKVTAKIPEFSINSEKSAHALTPALTKSGLYTLFTKDAAFSDLSYADEIVFNEMYEISPKIAVNAAGISGTKSMGTSASIKTRTQKLAESETTVEFNRPFIFMIIDNESDIPVYIGTVTQI